MYFMSMIEIKSVIRDKLQKLGYCVSVNRDTMDATMDDSNTMKWIIRSGNPKRFEVEVEGRIISGVPNTSSEYKDDGNHAIGRFRKNRDGIDTFIEWLANINSDHQHLLEIVHPGALPPPSKFASGRFFSNCEYRQGGYVVRACAQSIVSIEGVELVSAEKPGSSAWFLLQVQLTHFTTYICTDGEVWYPVITNNNGKFRVISRHGRIDTLNKMNQRDKELIHNTVNYYVETTLGSSKCAEDDK